MSNARVLLGAQNLHIKFQNLKGKGLKKEHDVTNISTKVWKRQPTAFNVDKAIKGQ